MFQLFLLFKECLSPLYMKVSGFEQPELIPISASKREQTFIVHVVLKFQESDRYLRPDTPADFFRPHCPTSFNNLGPTFARTKSYHW